MTAAGAVSEGQAGARAMEATAAGRFLEMVGLSRRGSGARKTDQESSEPLLPPPKPKQQGQEGASMAIRSSEGEREQPVPPPAAAAAASQPSPHMIQAVRILSYRVRRPLPPSEAPITINDESGGGLVRRLRQRRREGQPFIVYVLKVREDAGRNGLT